MGTTRGSGSRETYAVIKAEEERWTRVGDRLAKSRGTYSPHRVIEMFYSEALAEWKHTLTGQDATCYIHAFASSLYCVQKYAMLAVSHIAESLRTRELTELANLALTPILPSIINVTLEQKLDISHEK